MYFKVYSSLLARLCWKLLIVLITQLILLFCPHALFPLLLSHRFHYLPSPTLHSLTLCSLTGNSGQSSLFIPAPEPWTDAFSYFPSFLHNKNLPLIIECSRWRFLYCVSLHRLSILLPCAEHAWAVPLGLWVSRQPLGRFGLGWPLNSFFPATGKLLLLESPNPALWKYF